MTSIELNKLHSYPILLEHSELVRNLLETERENKNERETFVECPFSPGIVSDLNNNKYTVENYKEIIECMDYLLMDMDYYNGVIYEMIDIVGVMKMKDIYVKPTKFTTNDELKNACKEWLDNDVEAFKKHGYINNWDVSNVTSMYWMFYECILNDSFDISNWDVSNVTDMSEMFASCKLNDSFDISNWNVSNVTDMSEMFYECMLNDSFDISNWNVSNVTDMSEMFYECVLNDSFDISNWNVSNVTRMSEMFYECVLNDSFDISNWNVSNVTNMSSMFIGCNLNDSFDISNWNDVL